MGAVIRILKQRKRSEGFFCLVGPPIGDGQAESTSALAQQYLPFHFACLYYVKHNFCGMQQANRGHGSVAIRLLHLRRSPANRRGFFPGRAKPIPLSDHGCDSVVILISAFSLLLNNQESKSGKNRLRSRDRNR